MQFEKGSSTFGVQKLLLSQHALKKIHGQFTLAAGVEMRWISFAGTIRSGLVVE